MKLYRLESPVASGGDVLNIADPKGRVSSFFIWNEGDDKPFMHSKPKAFAQRGIHFGDMAKADYLQGNIGVPIFSERAQNVLSAPLAEELAFYPCTVECEGKEVVYYLGKSRRYIPIVDELRSEFRTLSGGEKFLTKAAFIIDQSPEFYIARDKRYCERLVVSEMFMDICSSNQMNIKFAEPI